MRYNIYLFIFFLFSCTNTHDKNESKKAEDLTTIKSNITSFFNGAVNDEEQDLIIDSIHILSLDTLNQKKDSLESIKSWEIHAARLSNYSKKVEEDADKKKRLMELSQRLDQSGEHEKKEAIKLYRKAADLESQIVSISKHIQSIDSLIKHGKLDTINLTGYKATFKVFAHDSKQTNRDVESAEILLDKNFRINRSNLDRALSNVE
ncbi:hypothetical protein [Sphingobacterium kitahiroshimense]|uniref:hypothetical protein n=1 Tax=Sphingobacterium kitahiroshimense TaxID=470446 RepID=UPI00320AA754